MRRSRPLWIDLALLLAVVAIFAVPLALRLNTEGQAEGESYAGSDSSATARIEQLDPDYEPWFSPLFEPSSGEVESGLFALQAATGAGVLGFVLGRLSGRRRRSPASAAPATAVPATTVPATTAPAILAPTTSVPATTDAASPATAPTAPTAATAASPREGLAAPEAANAEGS